MGEELREGLVPYGSVVGRARGRGSHAGRGGGSLVEPTDDGTIDAASVDIVCASLSCAARVGDVRPRGADALCVAFGRGHPQDVCVVCYRRPGVSRGLCGWLACGALAEIKLS